MSPKNKQRLERIIILLILFIIQIVWFIVLWARIIEYSNIIQIILRMISMLLVLYLINKNESPAYRMSWIVLIGIVPLFGTLLFLIFGNKRPLKWMIRKLEKQKNHHRHELADAPNALKQLAKRDKRLSGLAKYVYDYEGMPVYADNLVNYYANGESMMEDLVRDLHQAKKRIFIEFFIVETGVMFDAIFEILVQKAREGLDVRFLYDDFGSITRLPDDFDRKLEEYGIKSLKFNPMKPILSTVYNTRDHRKYIIIDGKVAYTGGLNIADEYINVKERFGYWKDNMIRISGIATWNLTHLFLEMWNAFYPIDTNFIDFVDADTLLEATESLINYDLIDQSGFVQPFGDSPLDSEPIGENVFREILNNATEYVYIYTPYLVISYELQTAMQLAAKRGVEIILMTPGIPDKPLVFRMTRSHYRPLLKSGIRIFEYSPGFLHAKTFISDDKVATVGTINLDYRSLYLHFETSTLLYYHPVISEIKEDFEKSVTVSHEISLEDIRVGIIGAIWDSILRLLAPLV